MPDIHLMRQHGLTLAKARELAQRAADDLAQEYDLVTRWVGDTLHFSRSGVQGEMHVDEHRIDLAVTLGFLLKAFRGAFVQRIEHRIDTLLSEARKTTARPPAAGAAKSAKPARAAKPAKSANPARTKK